MADLQAAGKGYLVGGAAPPELELPEVPLSLDFHPTADVLATGLVDGTLRVGRYNNQAHEAAFVQVQPFRAGTGGCRSVRFSEDGTALFAGSADHSILALDAAGAMRWRTADAHRDPVSSLHVLSDTLLASGDDSGAVKVWDVRTPPRAVVEFDVFQDYVSDLASYPEAHPGHLLVTSGDGTLAAFDCRKGSGAAGMLGRSGELEEDILAVQITKGGRKVVCGTSEGVLLVFSWGNWDGPTDSFPGHPESVGSLLKVDEQTLLTGSSDGLIRVVGIQPSKLYGLVGDHDGFPIERMRWSRDLNLVGSISHDTTVRFWDVSYLHETDDDEDGDEDGGGAAAGGDQTSPELLASLRRQRAAAGGDVEDDEDDWEDEDEDGDTPGMSDDDEDGGEDDSDDGGGGGGGGGGRKGGKGGAQYKTPAQSFFSDL